MRATSGHVPALDGVRALAALGVLTTHVAFQTGSVDSSVVGSVLGRLDLAVAVFFALSGFLLWRPHAAAARGLREAPSAVRYLRHRVVRIWPAYLVVVVVVLSLLPAARGAGVTTWLANLFVAQIYVPYTLTSGLTQMWTLAVEVSFYLLLPVIAVSVARLRGDRARWRSPVLVAAAVACLAWPWLASTLPLAPGVAVDNWLPGHLGWFVAGMVLAESVSDGDETGSWPRRIAADRRIMGALAVVAYALACTPIAGPTGLAAVSSAEFATKTVLGAAVAFGLLAPIVLGDHRHRLLDSTMMQTLGRWSYGIFIWHLAVLAAVFGLFGFAAYGSSPWWVWSLTVIVSTGVAAASYGLVEEPARRRLRAWEKARTRADGDSGTATTVTSATTAASAGTVTHQSNPV